MLRCKLRYYIDNVCVILHILWKYCTSAYLFAGFRDTAAVYQFYSLHPWLPYIPFEHSYKNSTVVSKNNSRCKSTLLRYEYEYVPVLVFQSSCCGLVVVSRTLLSGKLQQLFFQPNLLLSRQQLVHRHSLILLQIQMQMPVHYIVWSSWHSGGRPSLAFFVSHMADVVPWLPSTPMVSRRMHWAVQQF